MIGESASLKRLIVRFSFGILLKHIECSNVFSEIMSQCFCFTIPRVSIDGEKTTYLEEIERSF